MSGPLEAVYHHVVHGFLNFLTDVLYALAACIVVIILNVFVWSRARKAESFYSAHLARSNEHTDLLLGLIGEQNDTLSRLGVTNSRILDAILQQPFRTISVSGTIDEQP